jgi:hypothetical protein
MDEVEPSIVPYQYVHVDANNGHVKNRSSRNNPSSSRLQSWSNNAVQPTGESPRGNTQLRDFNEQTMIGGNEGFHRQQQIAPRQTVVYYQNEPTMSMLPQNSVGYDLRYSESSVIPLAHSMVGSNVSRVPPIGYVKQSDPYQVPVAIHMPSSVRVAHTLPVVTSIAPTASHVVIANDANVKIETYADLDDQIILHDGNLEDSRNIVATANGNSLSSGHAKLKAKVTRDKERSGRGRGGVASKTKNGGFYEHPNAAKSENEEVLTKPVEEIIMDNNTENNRKTVKKERKDQTNNTSNEPNSYNRTPEGESSGRSNSKTGRGRGRGRGGRNLNVSESIATQDNLEAAKADQAETQPPSTYVSKRLRRTEDGSDDSIDDKETGRGGRGVRGGAGRGGRGGRGRGRGRSYDTSRGPPALPL